MKSIKTLSIIILSFAITQGSILNISAASNTSESNDTAQQEKYGEVLEYIENEDPDNLTDDTYKEPIHRVFIDEKRVNSTINKDGIQTYSSYGWTAKNTIKKTEYYTKTTTPSGQLPGGTRFGSGGGFYVNKSGGPKVSFSFGTSWGIVSYGLSVGSSSTNNVGGTFARADNKTDYFRAKIDRRIRYRRVLVDRYQYGRYKNSYYTTWTDVFSENVYAVKVK